MHDISTADNFVCILRSQDLKSHCNFPVILWTMLQIVFTCNKNFCAIYSSYMAVQFQGVQGRCKQSPDGKHRGQISTNSMESRKFSLVYLGRTREICAISSIVGKYRDLEIFSQRNGRPELCRFYYGKNRPFQKTQQLRRCFYTTSLALDAYLRFGSLLLQDCMLPSNSWLFSPAPLCCKQKPS